ncbi:putative malate dehydrogenase 1B [Echinops telfairi]|uniref:Malate dehydrogenase 1B n=1 Tax=Echinops telfairi TaxID=9371 RepID=A0ABM0ZQ42_ECHTE|nr:putative malate dehydrogenase 1B [Echinops telfairi]
MKSPIIWRELLDRGGKGMLLGGYNEFLEHAQLYYGITSSMTSELMLIVAQENLEAHLGQELEKETLSELITPLQVWITSASAPACYSLIPLLASGEVFGMDAEISVSLLDTKQEACLEAVLMHSQDLAAPLLRSIAICRQVEHAFLQAHVVIVLDDSYDKEVFGIEECTRSKVLLCRLYGYLIEKNAHPSVRVLVGGKSFVNLKAALLMRYAPNFACNIIAVAMGVEGHARGLLARKMKTTAAAIKDVIIWGNISGNNYVDLRKAKVFEYKSAICGPPHYYRPVLNLIFDNEWINKEFVATVKNLSDTGKQLGSTLVAHSIATTLKYWYQGSPPGEIVSAGVRSEGQFGIPDGLVFSMPVKFENGSWVVLTDLEDVEINEQIMARMTNDIIQEKLVAFGDVVDYQSYSSGTDLAGHCERNLSIREDNQEDESSTDEHKQKLHSDAVQNEGKDQVLSHNSEVNPMEQ